MIQQQLEFTQNVTIYRVDNTFRCGGVGNGVGGKGGVR